MATLDTLKARYLEAKEAYYNDQPLMSDAEFDKLEDRIRKLSPNWIELKKTGVKVKDKKTEVPLLRPMPSLAKMYPEAVLKFYNRPSSKKVKHWIWMDKLDGTSLQLVYDKGKPTRLITRGDGKRGGDISFFLPHLVKLGRIPRQIPTRNRVVLRVEGLMQKRVFKRHWATKFDNIRNCVNGLFNRMDMHPALKHVDLVVLGVYGLTLPQGFMRAIEWGFQVVDHQVLGQGQEGLLSQALCDRRSVSPYEMDGLVIAPTDWLMEYLDAEKPKQLIAFKLNDHENASEVKIKEVVWQKTRTGRWQPKIKIEPTRMDGVTVTNATAHNPVWMQDRGIGPGATVKVLRSGGVIPKIVETVKPAKFVGPPGKYEQRGKFFYLVDEDATVEIRKIHFFMTSLGIELLAQKTIAKLYDAGKMFQSIEWYIRQVDESRDDAGTVLDRFIGCGLGPRQSEKILDELRRVLLNKISLKKLMVASGCFESVGEKRLTQLEQTGLSMRELYKGRGTDLFQQILRIRGFKDKTAQAIVDGKMDFVKWFKPIKNLLKVDGRLPKADPVNMEGRLYGMNVTWTGYRDSVQESRVSAEGGTVAKFSAKTDVLLYRVGGKQSLKIERAGAKAMTWEQFCKKHSL
jgi:DNA ligase (NAD+)